MTIGMVEVIDRARWIPANSFKSMGSPILFSDMPVEDNGFMTHNSAPNQVTFNTPVALNEKLHFHGSSTAFGQAASGRPQRQLRRRRLSWCKTLPQLGPRTTIPDFRLRATAEMSKWLNYSKTFGSPARPDFTDAIAASTVVTHIYARSCYDHHA
jgi:hypothetical protein